ncbi:MAG: hypothetical protein V1875_06085 [Candidatus Altiarchaeota archaeon]
MIEPREAASPQMEQQSPLATLTGLLGNSFMRGRGPIVGSSFMPGEGDQTHQAEEFANQMMTQFNKNPIMTGISLVMDLMKTAGNFLFQDAGNVGVGMAMNMIDGNEAEQ